MWKGEGAQGCVVIRGGGLGGRNYVSYLSAAYTIYGLVVTWFCNEAWWWINRWLGFSSYKMKGKIWISLSFVVAMYFLSYILIAPVDLLPKVFRQSLVMFLFNALICIPLPLSLLVACYYKCIYTIQFKWNIPGMLRLEAYLQLGMKEESSY